jgi:uncharacterized protein (UPF0276 family)
VSAMIERDDAIPPLAELVAELGRVREVARINLDPSVPTPAVSFQEVAA